MPSGPALRFSHIGIFAVDPHSLAAFYEDVLAFTRTDSGELPGKDGETVKLVFLSRDPEEVCVTHTGQHVPLLRIRIPF